MGTGARCRFFSFLIIALVLLAARGGALWGREVELLVEDADLGIPLEGATVRLWDGTELRCDDEGRARFDAPDDRGVVVQGAYPGYETGRLLIPAEGRSFTLPLSLGGMLASSELVIEAAAPESAETRLGRSVALEGEELERSARIGIIEDVMTSIKLLPGVGYAGMYNALPSIRGGEPGDLMATLDGFYIADPYYWGGGFSIFDPNMIASAELSHGVFSARYGHTISGLLEVHSKTADQDAAEVDLGVSSSAVNLNLSLPLGNGRGGLLLMGRLTYWDPFVWAAQGLSRVVDNDVLAMVNYVSVAPYIRSGALSFNYRLNTNLELNAAAFIGADGVGADYENSSEEATRQEGHISYINTEMNFTWDNLQGFFLTGLTYNPRPDMVLKASAGAGFHDALMDALIDYDAVTDNDSGTALPEDTFDVAMLQDARVVNLQGRVDWDWGLGDTLLVAAGVQELYSRYTVEEEGRIPHDTPVYDEKGTVTFHHEMYEINTGVTNHLFTSAGYALAEYTSPGGRWGGELGLRLDHLAFVGENFSGDGPLPSPLAVNPRLSLDYNLLADRGALASLDLTAGTGLFSSMDKDLAYLDEGAGVEELLPNRSWTSVAGLAAEFSGGWTLSLEAYVKSIFNLAYQYTDYNATPSGVAYRFDGEGVAWGIDVMARKYESRWWDGWLSYSFSWVKYHEPGRTDLGLADTDIWFYPSFHRFHTLNLVLNIKPSKRFTIYARFGVASGAPIPKVGEITSATTNYHGENGAGTSVTRYYRTASYDDDSRSGPSLPLDLKFSWYLTGPGTKTRTEIYLGFENLLSLVYTPKGNTTFNQYSGEEDEGSSTAVYELPIPMISFGFKWSY